MIHSLQEMLEWVFQMTYFGDNSDLTDVKKGVCRVSKLVNKSRAATGQVLLHDIELEV